MPEESDSSFSYEVYQSFDGSNKRIAYEDYFDTQEDAKAAMIEHLKSLKSLPKNCTGSVYQRYSDGEWGCGTCFKWDGSNLDLLGPAY